MSDEDEGYPVTQPVFQHSSEGSLQYQIEIKELLEDLGHSLKYEEEYYDEESGEYKWKTPEGINPTMNEQGVRRVITRLKARLNKIFILSDIDEDQIEEITMDIGINVKDDLFMNWDYYEIRDASAATEILNLITDTVYATLRKGKKGNYLKFLSSITNNQEIRHRSSMERQEPQQERSSMNPLSLIFGRRR